jgi:hypothetical protein
VAGTKENSVSLWLLRFARQQPLYLMIASGAAGIIWAITGHAPSLSITLIYSFLLGNCTVLVLENLHTSCSWRTVSWWRPVKRQEKSLHPRLNSYRD